MAEESRLEVAPEESGVRLDKFLAARFPDVSRTILTRLIDEGEATVGGETRAKSFRVRTGNAVTIRIPLPEDSDAEVAAEDIPIEIIYSDADIAAIAKPAGICVHPSPGHTSGTLVNAMLSRFPKMAHVGSLKRPGVVHRLDLDTSGVILFALTPRAYKALTEQIKVKAISREYLAVVYGVPSSAVGRIEMPLGRDPENRRKFMVSSLGKPGVRHAITHFRVEERFKIASALAVRLETGRTHQIRVHMKAIGHPVCGDRTYAPERPDLGITRQALHARRISFTHPFTDQEFVAEAPLPDDIVQLMERLRRE